MIDLQKHRQEIAQLQKEIENREKALEEARGRLTSKKAEINHRLAKGESTGDVFIDSVIPFVGVDEKKLISLIDFNNKLKEAGGRFLILGISAKEPTMLIMAPSAARSNQYRSFYRLLIGRLNGNPLLITKKDKTVTLQLPFDHAFICERAEKIDSHDGILSFGSMSSMSICPFSFLETIVASQAGDASKGPVCWDRQDGQRFFYAGPFGAKDEENMRAEICSSLGCRLSTLTKLIQEIQSPSPTEMVAGADI